MYNFKEFELGPHFAQDKLEDFKKLISASQSFTVLSMPGVGVSYFLKYLMGQNWGYFIHVDLYSLPTLTLHEFYRLLLREVGGKPGPKSDEQVFLETKNMLKNYAQKYHKVVVVFSRFDQLKKELDANFLSNLQSLTTIEAGKIVAIFTSTKPLHEIVPEAVEGGNLIFYSKYLYFKPYSKEDLKKLLTLEPNPLLPKADLDRLIELSGGHNQLLHILLDSQKQQNLLLDQFVKLQMKGLIDYLNYQQRKQMQKIALRRAQAFGSEAQARRGYNFRDIDEYLVGVGLVKKEDHHYQLFSPLLTDYIKQNLPVKLPVKEAKLFNLLRKNTGRVVSKDEIFAIIWAEDPDKGTDWALDALIYRLRKNPYLAAQGYIIESHKKVGYSLVQV